MLKQFDSMPAGLLAAEPDELAGILGGPALIHLGGGRSPGIFVSVLLHGNEATGFFAVRQILRHYSDDDGRLHLPRAMSLFIGNVAAARHHLRHLDSQPDYNRVWPGSPLKATPEHDMMAAIVSQMKARGCFASIDIHNNTGRNPLYACVNRVDGPFLHLAALFSRTQVYFTEPKGVQSAAFAELCPSVTVECGRSGEAEGIDRAARLIDAALHLDHWPEHPPPEQDFGLYHTIAVVKVRPDVKIGFGEAQADLILPLTLEYWNFRRLRAGTAFARQRAGNGGEMLLSVTGTNGDPAAEEFFELQDDTLYLKRSVVPSMLTPDRTVIHQDCLCYFMEPMLPGSSR